MSSLFLKVFLWFWLAMALVILALVLTTELTRRRDEQFPRDSLTDNYTVFIAQNAAITYEREGQSSLASYLERLERQAGVRPRLYDEQGTELSGLGAQPGAQALIPRVIARASGPVRNPPGQKPIIGFPFSPMADDRWCSSSSRARVVSLR